MTLRLDYSNMLVQPGGIPEKLWSESGTLFPADAAKKEWDSLPKADPRWTI